MAMSKAATVKEYLDELPPERRRDIARVRSVVRKHLPSGYVETMRWGMIAYEIPLSRYPDTYNKQPLCYAGLAAQKNFNTLYLTGAYASSAQRKRLEQAFKKAGLKMDMGGSCLHFKTATDLPLDAIGDVIASTPPERMIELAEGARARRKTSRRGSSRGKKSR
jgi:hypothetical protein